MLTAWRLFAQHLRGRERSLAALFLLGVASSAASLATPLIGKSFVDAVAGHGEYHRVPGITLALVALAVADLLLGVASRLLHARLSADLLVGIRERVFAHCLNAPLEHLERFRHGDLITRFGSDLPKIQTLLVDGLLGLVQNLLFLLVAALILLQLSAELALWSFFGVIVALAITRAFRAPVERGTQRVREAMVDVSHFLAERLGGLRAIRLCAAQGEEQQRFASLNACFVNRLLRFQSTDMAATGLPGLALTVSLAWIYLLGGGLLERGEISLGTFIAFVLYQGRLAGPAAGLLGLVRNLQEVRVSLARVRELLAGEGAPPIRVGMATGDDDIVVDRVSFAYPGSDPLFKELSLQVQRGERVALFGTSGAGKSTLVQILCGLRSPGEGSVRLGRGIAEGDSLPVQAGYAGSDPLLLHATVAENLRYGTPRATMAELVRAASLAEAHTFITELPQGYDSLIGGRGLALSDGQRQRLAITRLILRNPSVLILDEALSALDQDTEAKVRRNLLETFSGRTMLVITHRLSALEEYDRLLLLSGGKLRRVTETDLREAFGAAGNVVSIAVADRKRDVYQTRGVRQCQA